MATEEEVPRHEHVQWCKERAFEFIDERNDLPGAMSSFISDMNKQSNTRQQLDTFLLTIGQNALIKNNASELRHWIDGF